MQQAFGRYRLVRHLASGGMGEVWLAEAAGAAGFLKRVVIKTLRAELTADPRLIEQFVAEGQLLEQLDHPNIAQILDLGHADGTWFLAMEYVEGFDLRALLRVAGGVGVGEVPTLCVLAAAARALEHAATRHGPDGRPLAIVHHDVTPSNLMVRQDGLVKLVDFGVARSAMRAHLEPGALRGKLPYLAPEQVRSPELVDARADLFSLGLIAVELLSGERAMQVADPTGLDTAWSLLPERVARLCAGLHPDTGALLRHLTALDPDARLTSAADANAAIRGRLAALAIVDIERPVAARLAEGFARLEAAAGGFSQTLGALVGAGSHPTDLSTGTVSLPGLADLGRPVVPAPELASLTVAPSQTQAGGSTTTTAPGLLSLASSSTAAGRAVRAGSPLVAEVGRPSGPLGLKRRIWFSLLLLLSLVAGLGWWLGGGNVESIAARSDAVQPVLMAAAPARPLTLQPPSTPPSTPPDDPGPPDAAAFRGGDTALATAADSVEPDASPAAASPASAPLSASASSAPPAAKPRKTPRMSHRSPVASRASRARVSRGQLVFRVLPADAEVRVDGRPAPRRPANGVYRLTLTAGRHKLSVRDPISGEVRQRVERVIAGEERRVSGFTLVRSLP